MVWCDSYVVVQSRRYNFVISGAALMFLGALANAGVARGVALNATSPVFSAIFAALLLGERVSRRVAVGIISSVVGTILLVV